MVEIWRVLTSCMTFSICVLVNFEKTTGGKANESDEYILTDTSEVTTTFPGCELLPVFE